MGAELLVDRRIEAGRDLVAAMAATGFDMSVAFWVKTAGEGLWFLYIGSESVAPGTVGDAYVTLGDCLFKVPDPEVEFSQVRIVEAQNPIARAAMQARDRRSGRPLVRIRDDQLGDLAVAEAYIYPRIGGPMTPLEILQAVFEITNQPAGAVVHPSVLTLRDGTKVTACIDGFQLKLPGELTIDATDAVSKLPRQIAGADLMNIQP